MAVDVQQFKQAQRKVWSSGDYPDIARYIQSVSDLVVERTAVGVGDELLDVATGSGNLAIAAARKDAKVTGLDLTPELLEVAGSRAAEAGVDVTFVEGDAEELSFPDDSFDVVTSIFGVIFVPRHKRGAEELVRVARPGGRIGFTGWTPEGTLGEMLKTVGSHMPPPPEGLKPPIMWGSEDYVRSLFEDLPAALSFERRTALFEHDGDPASWLAYNERVLGPIVMAKSMLEPQGKWDALRADLLELYAQQNSADNGTTRFEAEYLVSIGEVTG